MCAFVAAAPLVPRDHTGGYSWYPSIHPRVHTGEVLASVRAIRPGRSIHDLPNHPVQKFLPTPNPIHPQLSARNVWYFIHSFAHSDTWMGFGFLEECGMSEEQFFRYLREVIAEDDPQWVPVQQELPLLERALKLSHVSIEARARLSSRLHVILTALGHFWCSE